MDATCSGGKAAKRHDPPAAFDRGLRSCFSQKKREVGAGIRELFLMPGQHEGLQRLSQFGEFRVGGNEPGAAFDGEFSSKGVGVT
jgi:hypothetical protein